MEADNLSEREIVDFKKPRFQTEDFFRASRSRTTP